MKINDYIQQVIENDYVVGMAVIVFNMVNIASAQITYTDSQGHVYHENTILPADRKFAMDVLQQKADRFDGLVKRIVIDGHFGSKK
ncbi:MAG: hypothetical protein ABIF40_02155 [archaeon]